MTAADGSPHTGEDVWAIGPTDEGDTRPVRAPQHRHLSARHGTGCAAPILTLRVTGPLDTARLRSAAEQVLRRHPALRGRLVTGPGGAAMWTAKGTTPAPSPGTRPIVSLRRHGDTNHLLLLRPATGGVDPVGLLRAARAIAAAYRSPAGEAGEPAGDAADPETIDRFLADLLTDPEAAGGRAHWESRRPETAAEEVARGLVLRAAPPAPRIRVPVPLDGAARAAVLALARTGPGVDAVVLTAWRLLLTRIAPHETGSIAVFAEGAARQLPGTVGLLGRCVPLPVRGDAGGSLADLVRACRAEIDEAGEHADFFTHDGETGRFTVGYRHLDAPAEFSLGPHTRARLGTVHAPVDHVAVDLQSLLAGDDLRLCLEADPAALDAGLAHRLAGWLGDLLTRTPHLLGGTPQQVTATVLDPAAATARLDGGSRPVDGGTLLDVFDEQAGRTPDACAASDDRVRVDYRTLRAAVAALGGLLAERGVGAGDRVAVCMSRRVPLLAAILAVMRRGAHFLPVDPTHPAGRVAGLLRDAQPRLIVTDTDGSGCLAPSDHSRALLLDTLPAVTGTDDAPAGVRPEDLAYLIHTSGSTGRPKGVPITHASLLNYLRWASHHYGTDRGGGTLVHSSIAVDMTITSLFLPLLSGGTVTLLPSDEPHALAEAVSRAHALSPLKVTPSGLRLLTTLLPGRRIAHAVRHLVVGGEQLTAAALEGLAPDAAGLTVTNEYGPTEATVGCCAHTIRIGDVVPEVVPIGRPIWNTAIELRNPGGAAALPGTAGEIVVSGAGVATGYLDRPEETAARFTADPSGGGHAYRTGDLAVLRDDGTLEMLGRIDRQVKVHGYRVEPGEIEGVLTGDPRIAAAAVIPVSSREVTTLSAFLVPADPADGPALPEWARSLAGTRLPFYARPDTFHVLPELPVQGNGKVDRQRLAALSRDTAGAGPLDPGDPHVTTLARLWRQVLGSPPPGMEANFFTEGGDSVKAVLLTTHARRAGLLLGVHDIMEGRVFRRICAAARTGRSGGGPVRYGPIPLTPNQAGFFATRPAQPRRWSLRWITETPGDVDTGRLRSALETTVHRHPALWSVFTHTGRGWSGRLVPPAPAQVHVLDLADTPPAARDGAVRDFLARREQELDLDSAVFRLCLIRNDGTRRDRVVWIVHHLVADVVSLQILTDDLWHAYARPTGDPAGPTSDGYPDLLDEAGRPAVVFPAEHRATGAPRTLATSLDASIRELLLAAQRAEPRRGVAALAAALLTALADVRPDLPTVVCVEGHGRDLPGGDRASVVGWLTTFHSLVADRALLTDPQALIASLHRRLGHDTRRDGPLPPVALNYLGELPGGADPGLTPETGPESGAETGPESGADEPILFPLEVICWTRPGSLEVRWRHCPSWVAEATVARLAEAFARRLVLMLADPVPPARGTVRHPGSLDPADLRRITAIFEGS
ncbi:amino acid adenylation domain-containing protein [Streptosporangium becharense]|uniref:Amino acid adenylation domain-containing protein n=1 Tax=Streptosporangium becharense TaxID=1816182 RepID=A0A7W9IBX9_9ACTN|nr:amino acid adenylation domain-containing protein [Streptosporangium becharense]MBB2910617.1 amino acid adenylation domain-containing protein [Streptosporangium becharense]MBB5817313.1 amino acid adenylation domain-containing protein [Streptosporangium becharense]